MIKYDLSVECNNFKNLEMSDFQAYRDRVANYGRLAAAADNEGRYEEAIDYYTKAVEIFKHMMKCKHPTH